MIELTFGWMKDEITLGQATKVVYGKSTSYGSVLYRFAICFKDAYKRGIIKIVK